MVKELLILDGKPLDLEVFSKSLIKVVASENYRDEPIIAFLYGTKDGEYTHVALADKERLIRIQTQINLILQNLP